MSDKECVFLTNELNNYESFVFSSKNCTCISTFFELHNYVQKTIIIFPTINSTVLIVR